MKKARREPGLPLLFIRIIDASTSVVIGAVEQWLRSLQLLSGQFAGLVVLDHLIVELLAFCELAHSSALRRVGRS